MNTRRIEIYDTTLRDGTQGEGFNLSLQDKLLIAQKLDELGVDYIEGGFPGSNEKDRAFFQEVRGLKLEHAKVSAFGMTRRRGISAAVAAVRKETGARVGIHTHNDASLAVANALAAVRAGADHAQGTINGVGERCGNMDLIPLIANLRLKYHMDCLADGRSLKHLTDVSRYVYETANMNLVPGQPFVGSSAFAHKGGM